MTTPGSCTLLGLTLEGLQIVSVRDWPSARNAFTDDAFTGDTFDVVVTETRLPDLIGLPSLTDALMARVPVIALTTAPAYLQHAFFAAGYRTVLTKPCSWQELAGAIRAVVGAASR